MAVIKHAREREKGEERGTCERRRGGSGSSCRKGAWRRKEEAANRSIPYEAGKAEQRQESGTGRAAELRDERREKDGLREEGSAERLAWNWENNLAKYS